MKKDLKNSGGKRKQRWRSFKATLLLLFCLLNPFAGWLYLSRRSQQNSPEEAPISDTLKKTRLAVLPFLDTSPEKDCAELCMNLTERLFFELNTIDELKLASLGDVTAFAKPERSLSDIAEQLDVSFVVEGSVMKDDEGVKIFAQLIDTFEGSVLWSENYEPDGEELTTLHTSISSTVLNALAVSSI